MLELGKYYLQRNGMVVGPMLEYTPTSSFFREFAFQGKNLNGHNNLWKANGGFNVLDGKDDRDLVSEVYFKPLDEQPTEEIVVNEFKLEVGKYYKDRDGDVYGPLELSGNDKYPFIEPEDRSSWTSDGLYSVGYTSVTDLIEEVPNPAQETEQPKQEENKVKFKEITLTEALEILKSGSKVYVTDDEYNRVTMDRGDSVGWLLTVTKFEIEVKPVVKYLVVYGDFYNYQSISSTYYSSIEEFYSDYDQSQYPHAELIQFTRKEF
jgi:hypothetical protein